MGSAPNGDLQNMARQKARRQYNKIETDANKVVAIQDYRKKKIVILPRNLRQEDYLELLDDHCTPIVFATGPAGTGKTMLAVQMGMQKLENGEVDRIVVTRPAVSVDEQHGFLPGTLEQKMAPWTRPIFDVFHEYWTPKTVEQHIENKVIEIAPLAYMRGRTFKNCWIVADEMQNATPEQMKMLLTRIGNDSKIVVTGDLAQHDRGYTDNGLKDFTTRLQPNHSTIGCVHFVKQDVERHPAVVDVLDIYGEND
jgi:phosphate starvation-inducible PhoH-like protein